MEDKTRGVEMTISRRKFIGTAWILAKAGYFNVRTGNVTTGPPPTPLPKMNLFVRGGEIFAAGWNDPNYVKRISTYA
jgi:nitrite reductase/ring-hydroxylating ferredoxin subunit